MAKACGSMYAAYDHPLKAPDPTSKEALTYALLETVRMVLEGQESDDDKQAVTDNHGSHSDHTSSDAYTDPPAPRPPPPARKPSPKGGILGGPCAHCGATESPQWRRPLTKKVVLCNACGIYYSRHHSLPKRKKAPGLRHTTLEDIESKIEDSGNEDSDVRGSQRGARASTPMSDPMACDVSMPVRQQSNLGPAAAMRQDSILSEALHLKPIVTHRMQQESAGSAEGAAQEEERKAHTQPTQTPTHSMACASPMAQSLSMACMSPAASCGSPMHPAAQHPSGIAAPPTTPKKRPDDQIDALFDAQEMSLAKRAIKRAAAAAVAAASQAAATTSSTPAISTGTSTPVEQVIDPNNANFYVAPPMGVGRRAILTASLAASVGMQMPASMQHQLHQPPQQQQQHQVQQQQQHPQQHPQHPPHMGSAAMPMHHHMGMPRMSIIETLMHQQSQARMAAARPPSNAAAVHAFSALPGILMTTGNPGFHPQPQPTFTGHLRPVTTALSEQSGDSDAGMILLPVSTCRGPPSKPGSQQGSPVCGSRY